ncbi:MAG: MFS transporter [Pseudomonadota bacterium]
MTNERPEALPKKGENSGANAAATASAVAGDDGAAAAAKPELASKNPLAEIVQPFVDLFHAPRALWGVNIAYLIEGFVYFGVVGYLAMDFNRYVGLNDVQAGIMVSTFTAGITLSQFFFGGLADRWGIRVALVGALALMIGGRIFLAGAPNIGLAGTGLWSGVHFVAMAGILLVVLGYGMYQPAAYSAVRQLTTPKTAPIGYAMLYAVMNLGGFLPTFFTPVRRAVGIAGSYWIYAFFSLSGLVVTIALLSRRVVARSIAEAQAVGASAELRSTRTKERKREPFSLLRWLKSHPLADPKFAFFIFCLMPVQTLFAHNWLTLPMYVERAYRGTWLGDHFEAAVNFNPVLIFVLVPIVAAITQKTKVYTLMIAGTLVMAAPTFLLATGPSFAALLGYIVLMTVGEAMWQPRFLQYAAEIAPEGRTGAYMGVAQLPWFLTKFGTGIYSGWFLSNFCPDQGSLRTEAMWTIYGLIAISTPVMLVLAKSWISKDMKTAAA